MPVYWGTRMRRGVWTKNWHWYAANMARLANFFLGNGLRTGAQIAQDNEKAMKAAGLRRVGFRSLTLPAKLSAHPKVTVVCLSCGKKFKRDGPLSGLRAHKTPTACRVTAR